MSYSYNINETVQHIKKLVDSNRCVVCDQLEGSRLRFTCGHSVCDNCATVTGHCLQCLTPPNTCDKPVPDNPLTLRVKHASHLLKTYQDAYNVDVYKRQRVSEQLKQEKELFPECIQAPLKYSNKKRSVNISLFTKENTQPFFPGEHISSQKNIKMEKSYYVQQWLEKNISNETIRKPFTDLNVNNQVNQFKNGSPYKKRADIIMEKVHENAENIIKKRRSTKRSHFKSTLSMVDSQTRIDKYLKETGNRDSFGWNVKRYKNEFDTRDKEQHKNDKDESGIVIDDEPIVIDDSQSQYIDKDKQAWLAVLATTTSEAYDPEPSVRLECNESIKFTNDVERSLTKSNEVTKQAESVCSKIPFYKKSYLFKTCKHCCDKYSTNEAIKKPKDLSITIESKDFITTIKLSNAIQNIPRVSNKNSISVQTDINGIDPQGGEVPMTEAVVEWNSLISNKKADDDVKESFEQNTTGNVIELQSQDLFTEEAKLLIEHNNILEKSKIDSEKDVILSKDAKNIVVADSDSDNDLNESSVIHVTADVHRSIDQLDGGILAELDQSDTLSRRRPRERGHTPNSTDSSDKENYDPNRAKQMKTTKKDFPKKCYKPKEKNAFRF